MAPTLKELHRLKEKVGPLPPEPRSSFLEWNYDAEIFAFGKRLNEEFEEDSLRRALTHRSYCNKLKDEGKEGLVDNVELIAEGETFIKNCVREEYGKKYAPVIVDSLEKYFLSEKLLAHVAFYIGLKDIVLTAVNCRLRKKTNKNRCAYLRLLLGIPCGRCNFSKQF